MPNAVNDLYGRFVAKLRLHAQIAAALHLLEWDQETFMPTGALDSRARQIGTLSALLHEQRTRPEFIGMVEELAQNLSQLTPGQAVDVRETKWQLDRIRSLDGDLVRRRSELHAQARGIWIVARRENDFPQLAPFLQLIIDMERQVAQTIDSGRPSYDVLLEAYEPGASTKAIAPLLQELRDGLLPLIERLKARLASKPLDTSGLCGHFPIEAQRAFNRNIAARLGFDFDRGRLDEAVHPFTTSIGNEVRLTTRYDAADLRYALYSTMHEVGHGLYEQGLEPANWGTPQGTSCSLSIHESQSRLWENQVGRSEAFWRWLLPVAGGFFPELKETSIESAIAAVNGARPSLIRTEADEITYNLHIIIRFEIETALIAGELEASALPGIWREKMQHYLGVEPETDREGVLQDVHWASGAIGYFPTYALGNIYAAQLMSAAVASLGSLEAPLAAGDFGILLAWLRTQVHQRGQTYRAPALIQAITGQAPTAAHLLAYLEQKIARLESG